LKHLRKKVSMKEQLEAALMEISGEPVDGSDFEEEEPEQGFSDVSLLLSTFLYGLPTAPTKQGR
jgi:hypothetical protein